MTRQEAFDEINRIQDEYIDELILLMNDSSYDSIKMINFTSATGTGKTKMMSKLINKLSDCYFIITTLSKGQLHVQIGNSLDKDCKQKNYTVYGSADYRINSVLQANDIISKIPDGIKCIWLRDEGHIRTNRFEELLLDVCYKVVNFSATNAHSDIMCNFVQTMMLRTVTQTTGTPEDAIEKLLEIKEAHKDVHGYNPCAIFRCVGGDDKLYSLIVDLCESNGLRYIDITEDPYVMSELCEDDNEYDVIINKFKIVEGIDIRRAHVLYMDNQPANNATTIQVIGRCRRNALLYRDDIDIFAPENTDLLKNTRECFVYYNVTSMKIDTDDNGELYYAFCDHISCESLKAGTSVEVFDGRLSNGLYVIELEGQTGKYYVETDPDTGFNIVNPVTSFYDMEVKHIDNNYIYVALDKSNFRKVHIDDIKYMNVSDTKEEFDWSNGRKKLIKVEPYYDFKKQEVIKYDIPCVIQDDARELFFDRMNTYTYDYLFSKIKDKCLDYVISNSPSYDVDMIKTYVASYILANEDERFCALLSAIIGKQKTIPNLSCGEILKSYFQNDDALLLAYYCIIRYQSGVKYNNILSYINSFCSLRYDSSHNLSTLKYEASDLTNAILNNNFQTIVLSNHTFRPRLFPNFQSFVFIMNTRSDNIMITKQDVCDYFDKIDNTINWLISMQEYFCVDSSYTINKIMDLINASSQAIANNMCPTVKCTFCEDITNDELYLIKKGIVKYYSEMSVLEAQKISNTYNAYDKIVNDKTSAIIGVDLMKQVRTDNGVVWAESRSISSKIGNYNKFNAFISNRYKNELEQARSQCFRGENSFELDKKCNSMIGYCVEYYSKYLVYGKSYLSYYIEQAKSESYTKKVNDGIIIRACMLKYREMMVRCFGSGVNKIIQSISASELVRDNYTEFIKLIIELGTKTAEYVKKTLYDGVTPKNDVDPDLSIRHITGLADYITQDTILDVKVRNNIDEVCVRQVLGYHYLSTKRSDLNIKRLIIYDAVSGRSVIVNVTS